MIISLISFLGLIFGYYLTRKFKQEFKQIEKFINIAIKITLILLIVILALLSIPNLKFIIAIIIGILIGFIIKKIYFYFGITLMLANFMSANSEFGIAVLIFVYGLLFSSLNFKQINHKFILINLALFLLPFILLLFREFTLQNSNIIIGFVIGGLINGLRFISKKAKK